VSWRRRHPAIIGGLVGLCLSEPAFAAPRGQNGQPGSGSGATIYRAACAACHGADGRGTPQTTIGFDKPDTFPDFTACDQTTPELDIDWKATIRDGGRARGFSRIMPAFGDALTSADIDAVVAYLRGLCREAAWPRGELNLPRPIATEKAFPENEAVVSTSTRASGAHDVTTTAVYERRIGVANQVEVSVPFASVRDASGVGDISVGFKRALYSSLRRGSIVAVQGEAVLPTGDSMRGLGAGVTVFEAFAAYGQVLPSDAFLQLQGGTEQPSDTAIAPRAVFARAALGKSFRQEDGLGRMWSPMLELVADRDFEPDSRTNVDIMPEMQVTLSRRQHVRASAGVQVPVSNTSGRGVQILFYVLWDWFDGRLADGWR
jgi:mono/diheme cytochrome c family protein